MSNDPNNPQYGAWMTAADAADVARILAWRPDLNIIGAYPYLHLYRTVVNCPVTRAPTIRLYRLVRANIGAIYASHDLAPTYQQRLQWIHSGFEIVLAAELPFADWALLSEGIEGLIVDAQRNAERDAERDAEGDAERDALPM